MKILTVTTEPTVEPITLAEAKEALRVLHTDDDTRITALITAARKFAEEYTDLYIMPQTVELAMDAWPSQIIEMGVWPLASIDTVKYDDTESPVTEQTLVENTDYYTDTTTIQGRVVSISGWPSVAEQPNPIRISMTAGYVAAGSPESYPVPENLKEGIKAYLAYLYDQDSQMEEIAKKILWSSRIL